MFKSSIRRFITCILVTVIAGVMLTSNLNRVSAGSPGINQLNAFQFDCAHFRFIAESNLASGYAAVRIWMGSPKRYAHWAPLAHTDSWEGVYFDLPPVNCVG